MATPRSSASGAPASRRVLVTGAASGIGLETALALASGGDHVVVADRDVAGGKTTVRRILGAHGSAEFRELVEYVARKGDSIDVISGGDLRDHLATLA